MIREAAKRTVLGVLDLGAGARFFSAPASANVEFVLSFDPSLPMLRAGSQPDELTRLIGLLVVRPDLEAFHCVEGEPDCISTAHGVPSIDLVMAIALPAYIVYVEGTILRLAQFVASTGVRVMAVPDPESVFRRYGRLINRSSLTFAKVRPSDHRTGHCYKAIRPQGNRLGWRGTAGETGFLLKGENSLSMRLKGVPRHVDPTRLILLHWPSAVQPTVAAQR